MNNHNEGSSILHVLLQFLTTNRQRQTTRHVFGINVLKMQQYVFCKRIVMKTTLSVYLLQCRIREKKNTAVRGNNAIESD
jgi:hypothetical protein